MKSLRYQAARALFRLAILLSAQTTSPGRINQLVMLIAGSVNLVNGGEEQASGNSAMTKGEGLRLGSQAGVGFACPVPDPGDYLRVVL